MGVEDYLELLDWTGRQTVAGKTGTIPAHLSPVLQRLGIVPQGWCELATGFGRLFHRVAGSPASVAHEAASTSVSFADRFVQRHLLQQIQEGQQIELTEHPHLLASLNLLEIRTRPRRPRASPLHGERQLELVFGAVFGRLLIWLPLLSVCFPDGTMLVWYLMLNSMPSSPGLWRLPSPAGSPARLPAAWRVCISAWRRRPSTKTLWNGSPSRNIISLDSEELAS
jgi:hypothetical protein